MMSKNRVLVFVVTFMSFIDYSYLSKIVVLPNIGDLNFGEYLRNIDWKGTGKILRDDEFYRVKDNYENVMKAEYEKSDNARLVREISNIAVQNEKQLLRTLMNYEGCGNTIQASLHEYIEKRKKYYDEKILKRDQAKKESIETKVAQPSTVVTTEETHPPEVAGTMHDDNEFLTIEEKKKEELDFLHSLDALADDKGRIRNLYLSTIYGSNQHIIHAEKNSIDSVWLYLLRTSDPMFGEKYNSYAFRVMSMNKMPLPQHQIPKFYGNGKLYLFDEFDIWPELNAVFVMYYLFNCPLQQAIMFDASHGVADISEHPPIISSYP